MNSKIISQGILKAIGVILGISILLFFLWKIQMVLVYIIIAAIISLIGRPIISFLKRKLKFPNTLAVVTVMSFFVSLIIGLISLFIPLISQQGKNLSLLNFNGLMDNFKTITSHLNEYLSSYNLNIIEEFKNLDLLSKFNEVPLLLNSIIGAVGSLSIGLFSVLFITFFLMKDSYLLQNGMLVFFTDKNEKRIKKSINTIKDLLSRYFVGLVLQITILFVIYSIVMVIVGVENGIVIAFLCALLNLVPYIGPLIGGILMLFLTMTSNLGQDFRTEILPAAYFVLVGYIIAQVIDNFISQPKIFSKATKAHPLEIFLVIIIGGLLFGITGMVIAVPMYTVLKVILKEFLSDNKIVKSLTKDI